MRRFSARELFDTNIYLWPCKKNELFTLVFDDGEEMETNTARTEISRKLWLAHEHYDRLPILKHHHIGKGPLSNSRLQDVTSAIVEDVQDIYGDNGYNREELWFRIYKTFEKVYNESIVDYSEYVRSSNSFDFNQLYTYPPIKEAREAIQPNNLSIKKGYDAVALILNRDPAIARNSIVSDIRAGLLKMEQLLQILVVRGFNTDVDSYIYPFPIMGNYFAGIHDAAEAMMESTLAAKAIIFTGAPLEQTEYANRKMQFTSQQVDLLVMNDCGARPVSEIEVTKARFRDMEGLYFYDAKTGRERALRSRDTDLINEKLSFRLPFNCNYRHHNNICQKCYGDLAYNIPFGTNIGHVASTMTQSEVSQAVLKVKHSEASTVSDLISINEDERPYILPGGEANEIRLNPRLARKGIKLLLRSVASQGIVNASKLPILKKSDVKEGISVSRFSQFRDVTFEIPVEGKQPMRVHASVSRGARQSYLTHQFLRFFLKQNFKIHDDGYYHISLDEWDFDHPAFEMPNRHGNMKDFAAEVEVFIRSTRDSSQRHLGRLKQLKGYDDPTEALLDLHELISSKMPVAFTHLAVVMLSMMVARNNGNDWRIPPTDTPVKFAKYDQIINGRSLGALFAYQGGRKLLEDLDQYENTNRPQHVLDCLLSPQ